MTLRLFWVYATNMKLIQWLKNNGITQTEFAKKVGVDVSYITHLTKGRRVPSLTTALKIQELTEGAVPVTSWVNVGSSGPFVG